MDDEELWKRRFMAMTVVRAMGLIVFFFGVAIAYSDMLRPGGWPQVGAVLAIVGGIDVLFGPRLLKKRWDDRGR